MVRMSVCYPNQPDTHFNHAYYANEHRRLVEKCMRPHGLQRVEIEKGIVGYLGAPAPYTAAGHLLFESMEALGAAWSAGGEELLADIPRYTDTQPVVQISEVVTS